MHLTHTYWSLVVMWVVGSTSLLPPDPSFKRHVGPVMLMNCQN